MSFGKFRNSLNFFLNCEPTLGYNGRINYYILTFLAMNCTSLYVWCCLMMWLLCNHFFFSLVVCRLLFVLVNYITYRFSSMSVCFSGSFLAYSCIQLLLFLFVLKNKIWRWLWSCFHNLVKFVQTFTFTLVTKDAHLCFINIGVSLVNTIFVTRTVLLQLLRDQFGQFLLVRLDFNVHSILSSFDVCL